MRIHILIKIDPTCFTPRLAESTYKLISEDLFTVNVDTSNFNYLPFLQDLSLEFSVGCVGYTYYRKRERKKEKEKE